LILLGILIKLAQERTKDADKLLTNGE